MDDISSTAAIRRPGEHRAQLVLMVVAIAQLMTALDATIVNIALPTAQHALAFSDAQRQWVVTAYTVVFGGLLLLGGRVADTLGRRTSFQIGLTGFGLASLLAGCAPNLPVLIAGRAAQGAFAALIAPTALSLLAVTFTEQKQRARAYAVYGAVASSGAAAGLLVGGVLTEYVEWRWCLFVNAVVAAGMVVVGRRVLPNPPRSGSTGIDVPSAALATGGLAALVFGFSRAAETGWASLGAMCAFVTAVAALIALGIRQTRLPRPLVPLHLFRDRNRSGAYLAVAVAVLGTFGMFIMLTYYLQVVLQYSAVRAGLAVLPLTLANALSGYQLGNRLLPRIAAHYLIAGGLLVAAGGLTVLSQLSTDGAFVSTVLPAEVLVGMGMGAIFPPAFQLATRDVPPSDAGVASALANVTTQVGGSIGTAVLNTIAVSSTTTYAATHNTSAIPTPAALVHGYAAATTWSAGMLAVAAVIVLFLINTPRPRWNPEEA